MSSNAHPRHKAHKVKLGFDQLDCPGIFGTLLDRYPELDPWEDEAAVVAEPILGPSSDPRYHGDNIEALGVNSHLWKEECFREAEEKLDRGIMALLMNLATLVSNMDDLGDLVESMRIPRQIAPQLVTTYKPVMVTILQMYTSCSYHMLVVWYWSEMGDEFRKLYGLQKIFDFMGLGSKCADIMSCHGYGPVDTGLQGLLKPGMCINHQEHTPLKSVGLDGPNELNNTLETSPSGSCYSSGENGENRTDGEVSTTSINPGLKHQKSVSFEDLNQNSDTDRNSVVAGLWVKVLERDTDGTIRWVKVTHSESE